MEEFVWSLDVKIDRGRLRVVSHSRFSARVPSFAYVARTPTDSPTEPNRCEFNSQIIVQR